MDRHIIHLHIPSFPIAVARVKHPELRNRPVAVAPPHSERALILSVSAEARQEGMLTLPVSVQLAYREGERLVRASKAVDVRIKLDTTRLHRRLDSKLDLLMGKVPKELKG